MANVILLAEDSADDELVFRRVLMENHVENPVIAVQDGVEVIAYLAGEGHFANREKYPFPTVLCLDIKMPRMDGFAVLEWLKKNPSIRDKVLIVVLTQYGDSAQIRHAYDLGAHSFLPKPFSVEDSENLIRHFAHYWARSDDKTRPAQPTAENQVPPIEITNDSPALTVAREASAETADSESTETDPDYRQGRAEARQAARVILLAEDSPESALLFKLVLNKNRVENPVRVVQDGRETIAYLEGQGQYADREAYPMPGILCLDLRMPVLDGFAVLQWLQKHPALKLGLLTVVLSEDINGLGKAYAMGADSFLPKPFCSQDVANLIRYFEGYWVQSDKANKPG